MDVGKIIFIKCQRCGMCCMTGVCSFGEELEDGTCKYLTFDNGVASCQLFIEGKVTKEDIGIDKGCVLRQLPSIFNFYKEQLRVRALPMINLELNEVIE